MRILATCSLGLAVLHGCAVLHHGARPVHTIFVLDSTASIVPDSFTRAARAIEAEVDQMQRGDCITVLPIISDSDAIPSDEIVRGCAPTNRQPYDQDLKVFRLKLHEALAEQDRKLSSRRSVETDILGTMNLVDQELAMDAPPVRRQVVIFSDFIEEDGARNFTRAAEVSNVAAAATLARDMTRRKNAAGTKTENWNGVQVLLAGVQSTELPKLAEARREAIRAFWNEYFEARHAQPTYVNDGPGICSRFLAR